MSAAGAYIQSVSDYRQPLEAALGIPFTEGNLVQPLRNGVEIFPSMLDAIESATDHIHLLTFIYWTGGIAQRMGEALSARARAGVRVRVLLDAFGAKSMSKELLSQMTEAGVDVRWFRPFARWKFWEVAHRTHRKILVCDGRVGFTGGVGIAEEWEGNARHPGEWRETHFRIEGPAVKGLQSAFLCNWFEACGETFSMANTPPPSLPQGRGAVQVVRSTAAIGWSDVAVLVRHLINETRRTLRITTAYFVPDEMTIAGFRRAAARGVEIQILMPGACMDHRVVQEAGEAAYEELMEAGIRIWRYQPTMLHAKIMIIDSRLACIGTANFNQRSMTKDDEVCLVVLDDELVATLHRHFEEDCGRSEEYTLEKWRRRGLRQRMKERFWNGFRHWF
jgi:cardiolipin synthase